ncbi:hypothetical protein [Plantactinospora sp. BB1]|uniref:hypothetical protein n=1 Tax=Plantactinospora sp. BB1 TaxID=2071627 RepID=UPI000D15A2B0|nr:hypothetical protein [Plantactinospora sp. BB1]AVT35772.1 hypothetical protein C6W10_04070 [Plantactinospora sp. BB1]
MTQHSNADPTGDGHRSKTQVARHGATETGQRLAQTGGGLAHNAADRGRDVAAEAGRQANELMGQASAQLKEQASAQQHRAASGLRALGDELRAMSERSEQQGVGKDLVQQAADRVQRAAQWLDQREPGMVLNDVRDYARRNPGLFLAGAAVAGVLAGRLTRTRDALQGGGGSEPHPDGRQTEAGHPDAGMLGRPAGMTGPSQAGQPHGNPEAGQRGGSGDGRATEVRR